MKTQLPGRTLGLSFFLFFVFLVPPAQGQETPYAGYVLFPQGSLKAVGMGGAFTAISDDASGILFNPAGLAHGDWKFTFDGSNNPVDNQEQGATNKSNSSFRFGSLAYRIGKNWVVGLGVSTPFVFEETVFSGFSSEVSLKILSGDLLLAWKLGKLAVGVAGHYQVLDMSVKRLPSGQTLEESASLIYPSVGLSYRDKKFGLGVSFSPSRSFDVAETQNSTLGGVFFRDFDSPMRLSAGAFMRARDRITIAFDVDYFFNTGALILPGRNIGATDVSAQTLDKTFVVPHAGIDYIAVKGKTAAFTVRLGGYIEPSRLVDGESRAHITYGVEARLGPVVIGVSFDTAADFQNSSQAP